MRVADTAKTKNLEVTAPGGHLIEEMEEALAEVASSLGLYLSHITTLGKKRYPGNRHWHLKQDPSTTGCLDVTYWPSRPLLWISVRTSEPAWVHEAGPQLRDALEVHLGQHDHSGLAG